MVSHCASPSWHGPFHPLKQGRLIVLPPLHKSAAQEAALLDVAWLCENCAGSFSVARDNDGRVQVARARPIAA